MPAELIYSYSREQALDDGVLIDVSETAREASFKFPVALTATLWHELIEPTEALISQGQSTEGRLWDALTMLRFAARKSDTDLIIYTCLFQMAPDQPAVQKQIKAHIGPGDTMAPVITLMLPEED